MRELLLMCDRQEADGSVEAEPVVVLIDGGEVTFTLDDGTHLHFPAELFFAALSPTQHERTAA